MSKQTPFTCKCKNNIFFVNLDNNYENSFFIFCSKCSTTYDIKYENDIILGGKFKIIKRS